MYEAPALATPAAIVPTPRPATSLTPIRARRVDRPQVGDQLGEVLDRVDVVVRRRADVALAGLAAAERGDVGRRLAPGQLAALAGLGALGDLDLELVGAGEVRGGHAEPGRGDLLDPRVVAPAVRARHVPGRILAALAGVRGAAGALDPDRQRLVGLRAEARRRSSPRRRSGGRSSAASSTSSSGDGGPRRADAQLVARRRTRSVAGPGERGAVAGERPRRCRRRDAVGAADREEPGSRRRSSARRGGPRRRPGSARSPGSGQARLATGGAVPGWPAAAVAAAELARRRDRRGSSGRATPAAVGKQRATTRRVEVDDVDQRAADVRRDGADAHPGQRLAQAGLERGDEVGRRCRPGSASSAPRVPASSAASSIASRGLDGRRPDGEDHRHRVDVEDVDGARRRCPSGRAGRPRSARCGRRRSARIDGTGRRSMRPGARRSGRGRSAPRRAARDGLGGRADRGRPRGRPGPPPASHGRIERPDRAAPSARTPRAGRRGRRRSGAARRSGPRRRAAARRAAPAAGRARPAGP